MVDGAVGLAGEASAEAAHGQAGPASRPASCQAAAATATSKLGRLSRTVNKAATRGPELTGRRASSGLASAAAHPDTPLPLVCRCGCAQMDLLLATPQRCCQAWKRGRSVGPPRVPPDEHNAPARPALWPAEERRVNFAFG